MSLCTQATTGVNILFTFTIRLVEIPVFYYAFNMHSFYSNEAMHFFIYLTAICINIVN